MTAKEWYSITLLVVILGGCQTTPSEVPEKDRETMAAIAALEEPVVLSAGAAKAARLIDGLPSWVSGTYGAAEVEALVVAAGELQKLPAEEVRAAVASRSRMGLESAGKVYLLLRVFFDVPETMEFSKAKVFGGWRRPRPGNADQPFPVRWPVNVSGGKVVSVEGLLGYSGAAYDGGGEFDFFKANWGLRKL